jgi:predicted phosphodiesterase
MIYLCGDIHGYLDIEKLGHDKFPEGSELTRLDYVIILGDYGLIWDDSPEFEYWSKWLDNKPWTTLFIDGNHENFDKLYKLPITEKFGCPVGVHMGNIFHLKRGYVYHINDLKFFVMGGASSVDKHSRSEHIDWWKEELPNYSETDKGLQSLEEHNWKVDYVLTHTCPSTVASHFVKNVKPDNFTNYLNFISETLNYNHWYFGHFHEDKTVDKFSCLFNKIEGVYSNA